MRDKYHIIAQHPDMGSGDSAARMGISALENELDFLKIHIFMTKEGLVRHPYSSEVLANGFACNDPDGTSRDQLVQWAVSVIHSGTIRYAKSWFINKDFLDPAVKLYLYKCSFISPPLWLKIIGTAWMWFSLIWNTKIKPNDELNPFTCMCIRMGPWWAKRLIEWHPDIESNIKSYWSGWRDQPELGEILIRALKNKAQKSQKALIS